MVNFNLINENIQEGDEYFQLEVTIQPGSQDRAMVDPNRNIVTIKIQGGDGSQGKNGSFNNS